MFGEVIINNANTVQTISNVIEERTVELEERITKLENFIKKILPILPDEVKLYLEVSEGD